jgi:hypothetical protein
MYLSRLNKDNIETSCGIGFYVCGVDMEYLHS